MKRFIIWLIVTILSWEGIICQNQQCTDSTNIIADSCIYGQFEELCRDIVLLKKQSDNFPIEDLIKDKVAFVVFSQIEEWRNYIWRYQHLPIFDGNKDNYQYLILKENVNHIIILSSEERDFDVSKLDSLNDIKKSIIFLGNHKRIDLSVTNKFNDIIFVPTNSSVARDVSVQAIFGAIDIKGVLKSNISDEFQKGFGIECESIGRLRYLPPESIGMCGIDIHPKVDSIVHNAILNGAFPGCRVFVAVKGNVIFNEAYGYHTYNKRIKVQLHDVYDLASVTKITGPLPLIMKACDEQLINLDAPFSDYWEDWKGKLFHRSNKEALIFREILAHQARLTPYINYFPITLKDKEYNTKWYSLLPTDQKDIRIDQNLYLSGKIKKEVYKAIRKSPLLEDSRYKYSGLSFMIYPELLTQFFEIPYENALYNSFCKPLGASSLRYNPIGKVDDSRIVPTEFDQYFRKKQIKGLVHDEAAAIMGGVSGNAGLFSTADDLAKMMQMYLNKGVYAGKTYISKKTFEDFVKVQFPENENRRGAGFDKPLFGNDTLSIKDSYPAPSVSPESFGHSGFTGTFVWLDPKYEMVYIFLSNRVYPTRENSLIYRMNVRPSIQQIFYDALDGVD